MAALEGTAAADLFVAEMVRTAHIVTWGRNTASTGQGRQDPAETER
jgi:hypothetical protein